MVIDAMAGNALVTLEVRRSRAEDKAAATEILRVINESMTSHASPGGMRLNRLLGFFSLAESSREALRGACAVLGLSSMMTRGIVGTLLPPESFPDKDLQMAATVFAEAVKEVNRLLSHYNWTPTLRAHYAYLYPSTNLGSQTDADLWENWAVAWLFDVRNVGGPPIFRIRCCAHCQRWFYALTNHAIYCRPKCRVGAYNKTPEGRAKHAMSQKVSRERIREQELAALARLKI